MGRDSDVKSIDTDGRSLQTPTQLKLDLKELKRKESKIRDEVNNLRRKSDVKVEEILGQWRKDLNEQNPQQQDQPNQVVDNPSESDSEGEEFPLMQQNDDRMNTERSEIELTSSQLMNNSKEEQINVVTDPDQSDKIQQISIIENANIP